MNYNKVISSFKELIKRTMKWLIYFVSERIWNNKEVKELLEKTLRKALVICKEKFVNSII